jgi:hypothetical protein
MPSLVSYIALGIGLMLAALGLFALLTGVRMNPRAKHTLLLFHRELNVRTLAVVICISSCLLIVVPLMSLPVVKQEEKAIHEGRLESQPHEKSGAVTAQSVAVEQQETHEHDEIPSSNNPETVHLTGDQSVVLERQETRGRGERQSSNDHEPFNLTGEWTIINTVLETNYTPYRNLRIGFHMRIRQDGHEFKGEGEKRIENGHTIPVSVRRPIRVQGTIEDGSVIAATFQEDGLYRPINGRFSLRIDDRDHLTGTFISTAANARGPSQWVRASSRRVAHARMSDQQGRAGLNAPPPTSTPDQGAPPVIALVAPGPGQQVSTPELRVSGTATGTAGIVRVDVQVNGELWARGQAPGWEAVEFSKQVSLRPGSNEIVVTAFDQRNRAARRLVTVTRIEERSLPLTHPEGAAASRGTGVARQMGATQASRADEPRAQAPPQAPVSSSTARQSRPRPQLGMTQAEVRGLLGEPVSVEDTPEFAFWHYGPETYVVFEQGTGRVYGWLGFSS